MTGVVCYIMPAIFPILYAISKAFDGIIDIPFAHITDTLQTKWGKRRPAIAVCALPMIISFALCWLPIGGYGVETANAQLINTIWIICWSLVFFSTYTMCMIAFYGSLTSVCIGEPQRLRVANYKSFFDTISYCLVYALVPVLLDAFNLHIDRFVFILLPFMLTITIPLFLIKEGEKYGYPEKEGTREERVKILESLKLTFTSRPFMSWTAVNCCAFFGLQMFLVSMNSLILGGMGFNGGEMALINTCAFAPVPVMLYLFGKLKAKKGLRFAYQICLACFAVAILSFDFASLFVTGGNKPVQYAIACIGGLLGSMGIAAFFMVQYLVPVQVAATEEKITGKNHSAMYFAAQAVCTSIIGAIASSLVWENIKMLFITKDFSKGIVWAENVSDAAASFGVLESATFNLGILLVPIVVSIFCIGGILLAFLMPKDYTPTEIAKMLKKQDPSLDISSVTADEEKEEKGEIVFVQIALSILSGFIFGFIWLGVMLKNLKTLTGKKNNLLWWLLGTLVPFGGIFVALKLDADMKELNKKHGLTLKGNKALYCITGALLPMLFMNFISLAVLQSNLNKLLNNDAKEEIA
jgi:Na+/melibiose symporter-like transporter